MSLTPNLTPNQIQTFRAQFVERLTMYRGLEPIDAATATLLFDALLLDEENVALMLDPHFDGFCQAYMPRVETVFDRHEGCMYMNHPVRPLKTPVDDWCVYRFDNQTDHLSYLYVCRPSEEYPTPIDWSDNRLF